MYLTIDSLNSGDILSPLFFLCANTSNFLTIHSVATLLKNCHMIVKNLTLAMHFQMWYYTGGEKPVFSTINRNGVTTMSKQYPFSRTISKQNVIALVFNKETAEATNMNVAISPPIADTEKLSKAVAKKIDNSTLKFIEIVDVSIDEKLYGLTIEDFMANAVELDPKTRKPIEA